MKKNKMMRAASGLLVATLLTTSIISGTFAKYTTTNSGSDSATVAKFGVTISVDDDMNLFNTQYDADDDDATSAQTVVTATTNQNKIAPGTKGSMQFSITGTPEVATQLTVAVDGVETAHLDAGTYTLDAGKFADRECKVTTATDYEPIKWYVGTDAITDNTAYDKTLADVEKYLEKLSGEKTPNTKLDATYYIGWKWDFESAFEGTWDYDSKTDAPYENAQIADFLDTYMGDQDTLQTESFKLSITVTQVD